MRRTVVVMCMLLVVFASQAWTEPASKYPKTVAGLQALLDQHPGAITVEQKVVVEGKGPEWVASPSADCPVDLKVSAGALSYYLNSADEYGTPLATVADGKIALNQRMSPFVFDDGFGQQSRDVQKAARSIRETQAKQQQELGGLTKSYDDLLSKNSGLSPGVIVVASVLTGAIFVLIFLNYREIKAIGGMKSGKTYAESEKETLKKVNTSLEKHEGAVAKKINDSFHGLRAEIFKHAERLQKLEGKPSSLPKPAAPEVAATIPSKPTFQKDELPPKWELDPKEITSNGNGTRNPAPTPLIPTPNTEGSPSSVTLAEVNSDLGQQHVQDTGLDTESREPLKPTELMSVLDKEARDQEQVQRLLERINNGDEGEETVTAHNPKLRRSLGLPGPKEEKVEERIEEKVSAN